MKVVFLTHDHPQGYRIQHYFPFLQRHGVEVDLGVIPRERRRRYRLFRELRRYDLVYVQRRLLGPFDLFLLRKTSRKLVYDFDDAVMYRSSKHSTAASLSRRLAFRRMVRASDAVIAGNQFLREEALKHTWEETVFVVPTVVDTDKYVMKDYGRPGNTVVLGWIGSRSTIWYLQNLVSVLETLCRRYSQLTMKVVSDAFPDCAALPIIKKRWNAAEEMSDLRSFDIGLVPLTDDVWSRGKCGLKAVQYLAVGIPVVCSPVGANREIIEDGVNGYWASTEAEWVEKISRLVEDPALRREMGSRGRKRVEEGFSLELASREVFTLFQRLCR